MVIKHYKHAQKKMTLDINVGIADICSAAAQKNAEVKATTITTL